MAPEILIAVLAPVGVALCRRLAEAIDKNIPKVALPVLAPVLGVVVDLVLAELGMGGIGTTGAAAAGLAGVGVREIADQGSRAVRS